MTTREQNSKAKSLVPILVCERPGEIPLGWTGPNSGFWIPDDSKRALLGYGVRVLNDQITAKRTAHNIRAHLEYEHADDRFTVHPAAWLITDKSQPHYDDKTDLEPGEMSMAVLAIRRGNKEPFEAFAAKMNQGVLMPVVPLHFGKWTVKGLISADYCESIEFTATFRIDENGNLVELQNIAEDIIGPKDKSALATPEEAARKNRDLIRKMLLSVIRSHLANDYKYILDVLDNSDRILVDDSLFKKWVNNYGIQCWSDIAENKKTRALFQKFLADVRKSAKQH